MKRRDGLTVLAGLPLFAAPAPVLSQPTTRTRRVGWLVEGWDSTSVRRYVHERDEAFRKRGWAPGKDMTYEIRMAHRTQAMFDEYAMELVRLDVDVLVTTGDRATRAAMRATSTIPIVFVGVPDPIKGRLVSSLSRPTENVTGIVAFGEELGAKRIEALRQLVPQVRTIAVLIYRSEKTVDSANPEREKLQASSAQWHAQFGIRPIFFHARIPETEIVIEAAARQRVDALALPALNYPNASIIAAAAIRHRLPSFGVDPKLVEAGMLLSLSADWNEQFEIVAELVDRILRGSKPADLPVRQATKFELVVNGNTARALGIRVPQSLLVRARMVE